MEQRQPMPARRPIETVAVSLVTGVSILLAACTNDDRRDVAPEPVDALLYVEAREDLDLMTKMFARTATVDGEGRAYLARLAADGVERLERDRAPYHVVVEACRSFHAYLRLCYAPADHAPAVHVSRDFLERNASTLTYPFVPRGPP